ncbi:hypothetical protein [Lacinutrix sp. MEBiC02404]
MKIISSKFSIKQVVVFPIITSLFVVFLISIISFLSVEMTIDGAPLYKTPIWCVLVFVLLLFWSIRHYLIVFKKYVFFEKGIEVKNVFGKEFYSWNDVKKVSIVKNRYEKILMQYLKEDTLTIHLKSGEVLELFSMYYKNMPSLRRYFKNKKDLKVTNSYDDNTNESIKPFNKSVFKGSFMMSFNGGLMVFFIVLSSFMLWHSWSSMTFVGVLVLLAIPLISLFVFGFQSYYFVIDGKFLLVKNHVFLHSKIQINLDEVRLIGFEQKLKKEPSIKIIYKDYSITSFQSSSLKESQWISLIRLLKEHNVNVVDELFYEFN